MYISQMFFMEGVYIRCCMDNHRIHRFLPDAPTRIEQWTWRCYQLLAIFVFGAASTHFLTNLPKYSVGRLRPHFLDVCKPDLSHINDTSRYIEEDVCTGDHERITEARCVFFFFFFQHNFIYDELILV